MMSTNHEIETETVTAFIEHWERVEHCPACRCKNASCVGVFDEDYRLRNLLIKAPPEHITFLECSDCGLVFKNLVPSLDQLKNVFERVPGGAWSKGYNYSSELALIRKFCKQDIVDVLDIGAAGGWLLKSFSGLKGRLSALDITKEKSLDESLRGEFIEGALDSVIKKWNQKPYDVVTVFDVIEHLYDPNVAFSNLSQFVKKRGIVIIETGDLMSAWPQRYGISNWWYAKLLEHHIFWTKDSLTRIGKEYGFIPIYVTKKKNKNVDNLPKNDLIRSTVRAALFWVSPWIYQKISKIRGTKFTQPRHFTAKDHILIVFRKE